MVYAQFSSGTAINAYPSRHTPLHAQHGCVVLWLKCCKLTKVNFFSTHLPHLCLIRGTDIRRQLPYKYEQGLFGKTPRLVRDRSCMLVDRDCLGQRLLFPGNIYKKGQHFPKRMYNCTNCWLWRSNYIYIYTDTNKRWGK